MIPRHNILLYLDEYGNNIQEADVKILFERINTTVDVFSMILKDLISKNLISCKGFHQLSSYYNQYIFPEALNNFQIGLTDSGKLYVERRIKNTKKKIEFSQDPLDSILIGNSSFHIPTFQSTSFDDFREKYKGKLNTDISLVYFLLTGKAINKNGINIFISYAWGDKHHEKWVKSVADKLKEHYNVIFDQYGCFKTGEDKFTEMKKAIIKADKVLVILTPEFKSKAEKKIGGVGYEFSVITKELKKYIDNDKYFPILRKGEREDSVPIFFENKFDFDARKGKYRFSKLLEIIRS